MKCFVCTCAL